MPYISSADFYFLWAVDVQNCMKKKMENQNCFEILKLT